MSAAAISFQAPVLAWSAAAGDEARYRRIQTIVLGLCLLVALLARFLPTPEILRDSPNSLPAPMAKLLSEPITPPPEPQPVTPTPTAADAAKPLAEAPAKPQKPEARAKAVVEARNPVAGKPPGEAIDAARRKAAGVGLLAMADSLNELHSAPTAVQLRSDIKPGPGVGTGTGVGVGAGTDPGLPTRALITSNAGGGSGGINTGSLSRDTGGGGLAGRSTTLVEGVAGGGGGGGPGGGGKSSSGTGTGGGKGGEMQRGKSGKAARSLEDIRLVFERNKGAIYAIYNRALREDPSLQGKVVLELKIAPGGQVEGLRVVSSELKAPELEAKLLARIRQFDFGAKDVDQLTLTWPLDFLPS